MTSINHSSSLHPLAPPAVAAPEPGVQGEQQRGGQQAEVGGRVEAGQPAGGQLARAKQVRHNNRPISRNFSQYLAVFIRLYYGHYTYARECRNA